MAQLNLPFGVYRSDKGPLDLKYEVLDDTARDALVTSNLLGLGQQIFHVGDGKIYFLDEYPTPGSLTGVVWAEIGKTIVKGKTTLSGTNDYTVDITPTLKELKDTQLLLVEVGTKNTGAATLDILNIPGHSPVSIKKKDNDGDLVDVEANDLTGFIYLVYDETSNVLQTMGGGDALVASDISNNPDFNVDTSKLATRSAIEAYLNSRTSTDLDFTNVENTDFATRGSIDAFLNSKIDAGNDFSLQGAKLATRAAIEAYLSFRTSSDLDFTNVANDDYATRATIKAFLDAQISADTDFTLDSGSLASRATIKSFLDAYLFTSAITSANSDFNVEGGKLATRTTIKAFLDALISSNPDFTLDGTSLTTRADIKAFLDSYIFSNAITAAGSDFTIDGSKLATRTTIKAFLDALISSDSDFTLDTTSLATRATIKTLVDTKANLAHTHGWSDITGAVSTNSALQAALDGKANANHSHPSDLPLATLEGSSTANQLNVTLTTAFTDYANGLVFIVAPTIVNTAAAVNVQVTGFTGNKVLVKKNGPLQAGDLIANKPYIFIYYNNEFVVSSLGGGSAQEETIKMRVTPNMFNYAEFDLDGKFEILEILIDTTGEITSLSIDGRAAGSLDYNLFTTMNSVTPSTSLPSSDVNTFGATATGKNYLRFTANFVGTWLTSAFITVKYKLLD